MHNATVVPGLEIVVPAKYVCKPYSMYVSVFRICNHADASCIAGKRLESMGANNCSIEIELTRCAMMSAI